MIAEATLRQPVSVAEARAIIGYRQTDGATSWEELSTILSHYQIKHTFHREFDFQGGLMAIVVDMGYVITNKDYEYEGNHYLLVFGETDEYYVVADPLSGGVEVYLKTEIERARYGLVLQVSQ